MVIKSQYNSLGEWCIANPSDYVSARRQGFLDKICDYYGWTRTKPAGHWIKDNCLKEALKYKTSGEWKKGSGSSYQAASSSGWLEECSSHFVNINKPSGYWTKERCVEDALKYKTKAEWEKKSSSAHSASIKNGWFDECTKHMTSPNRPKGYWTKERCLEEALKHKTKTDWKKAMSSSVAVARRNGWIDEAAKHMK